MRGRFTTNLTWCALVAFAFVAGMLFMAINLVNAGVCH